MMLSVNLIDSIPKKNFQKRLEMFIKEEEGTISSCKMLPLFRENIILLFYDNSITFNISKENSRQIEFVKKCIREVFQEEDIVYRCDKECSWINELNNTNIIRIN